MAELFWREVGRSSRLTGVACWGRKKLKERMTYRRDGSVRRFIWRRGSVADDLNSEAGNAHESDLIRILPGKLEHNGEATAAKEETRRT